MRLNLLSRFRYLMAFLYVIVGLLILFTQDFAPSIKGGFRIALGIVVIGYGAFRIYFNLNKSNRDQNQNPVLILISIISFSVLSSCSNSTTTDKVPNDFNPTIYVDETLEPVIKEELFVFNSIDGVEIKAVYVPGEVAIKALLNDSTSLIIVPNTLTQNQVEHLNKMTYYPKTSKIAIDAVSFITSSTIKSINLTYSQVADIISGKISTWNEFSAENKNLPLQVVFDNKESSTVRFIVDSVSKSASMGSNVTALQNNHSVIEYVANNKNAIGIIGVSWISDRNDSLHLSFLDKINVVSISNKNDSESFYKPYQAYMYDGVYPFTRNVYTINKETYSGILSRFVTFLNNDKGQRIILKSGLYPSNAPVRLIQVKSEL